MQLATKALFLACTIAFSTPQSLALPVSWAVNNLALRSVNHQKLDTREFDQLDLASRELIRQYHEAREFYDEIDSRMYHNGQPASSLKTRDNNNVHLDPELSKILLDSTKANTPIFLYAQQANRELEAYQRLATFDRLKNSELKTLINAKFISQEGYLNKIKAKDPVALAHSTMYRAKLATITSGQDAEAVSRKREKADRLERILNNPNGKKDIQDVIKELKAKNAEHGFMSLTL